MRRSDRAVKFLSTSLAGAFVIEMESVTDDRGYFARSFCVDEFARQGLDTQFVQSNVSFNLEAGTLRGMHYQIEPHAETKLVRCSRGAIFDVIVDIRPDSPTLGQWFAMELSHENLKMMYVPKGFAHGFQSLLPDTEVSYQMSDAYELTAGRGFRFDEPEIGIPGPLAVTQISDRDRHLPLWSERDT